MTPSEKSLPTVAVAITMTDRFDNDREKWVFGFGEPNPFLWLYVWRDGWWQKTHFLLCRVLRNKDVIDEVFFDTGVGFLTPDVLDAVIYEDHDFALRKWDEIRRLQTCC